MAIVSLEDLVSKDVNEGYEEYNNLDLISDYIERDLNTLNSIFNLDLLIMNLDKAKEQLELNKITLKELQEVLYNTSLTTSHMLKVLTDGPINKITKFISNTITLEDINNHPLIALEEQKNGLKKISSLIDPVNINKLKQSLVGKFKKFFNTLEEEYLYYDKKSKLLIDFYKKNRDYLTIKEDANISSQSDLLLSGFLNIVINNYNTYINGYEELRKMKEDDFYKLSESNLEFNLVSYKDIDFISCFGNGDDTGSLYPLALNLGNKKNNINTEVTSLKHNALGALLFGITDEKDIKKLDLGYTSVYVRTSKRLKIEDLDQVSKLLESSYEDTTKHFSINKMALVNPYVYFISIFEFFSKVIYWVAQKLVNVLEFIPFNGFFSKLSTGLISLSIKQNIYSNVYLAQRELISSLKVKDDIEDEKLKKELNEKLEKAINGKLK